MTNQLAVAIVAIVIATASATYTAYSYGYERGASVGYQAGVQQDRLYQRGHDMALNWHTYAATHR